MFKAPHNTADPLLDQSSLYFVHPSDGPSSVSVTPVLIVSNYHSWAQTMCLTLGGKLRFEFVDGTTPPVTDLFDPSFRAYMEYLQHVSSFMDPQFYLSLNCKN